MDGRPGNNYTVARVRRDIFQSSDIGAIILSREPAGDSDDFNRVAGVDTNFRFFKNLSINCFVARSESPRRDHQPGFRQGGDRLGRQPEAHATSIMKIGEGFKDDIGFVRRTGVTRQFYDVAGLPSRNRFASAASGRFSRTPAPSFTTIRGELVSRSIHIANQTTWNNGSYMEYAFEPRVEAISRPFKISPGVAIPAGRYDWKQHLLLYEGDHSKPLSGSIRYTFGGFWSGSQKVAGQRAVSPDLSNGVRPRPADQRHRARPAAGEFTTTLVNLRTGYSFSTNMFLDTLLQYRNDVKQFSANVRFNLIHRPLSDFFIVYNESQFTDITQPAGRGLVVKYTQMFSF